jgi:hypothetical protein
MKPKKTHIGVLVSPVVKKKLESLAASYDVPLTKICERALTWIAKNIKNKKG